MVSFCPFCSHKKLLDHIHSDTSPPKNFLWENELFSNCLPPRQTAYKWKVKLPLRHFFKLLASKFSIFLGRTQFGGEFKIFLFLWGEIILNPKKYFRKFYYLWCCVFIGGSLGWWGDIHHLLILGRPFYGCGCEEMFHNKS